MKAFIFLFFILQTTYLFSQQKYIKNYGVWRGELSMNDRLEIPFLFHFEKSGKKYKMCIENGTEKINLHCSFKKDSVTAFFPGIDSYLRFKADTLEMRGYWLNLNKKKTQMVPFTALKGIHSRFEWNIKNSSPFVLHPRYKIIFQEDVNESIAVGIFNASQDSLQGTIMTETGDYRFLAGSINGNKFKLSTFNGIWAMLVEGEIIGDSLVGNFYSGSSYRTRWTGKSDEHVMLRKANSLTYVVNDQPMNFSKIRKLNGKFYQPHSRENLTLFQVMGTWCPNCLDEINFFKELHLEYHQKGLKIIALAYENQVDLNTALSKLKRFKKRMQVPYEIFYAGNASKDAASETFPMLNQIMSFPTSLLIDRKGKIRYIHTGFSGPATGKAYEDYKKEVHQLINELLQE